MTILLDDIDPILTACTIADVQEERSAIEGLTRVSGSGLSIGRVRTAACAPNDNLGFLELMTYVEEGDFLVVGSIGDPTRHCFLGDNAALYAQTRGVAGIIVDGYVRDLSGLREVGLSIHARGSGIHERATKNGPFELDIPMTLSGVEILPGDFLAADDEMVCRIRSQRVEETLEKALQKSKIEQRMQTLIRQGLSPTEAYLEASRETI